MGDLVRNRLRFHLFCRKPDPLHVEMMMLTEPQGSPEAALGYDEMRVILWSSTVMRPLLEALK